MTWFPRNSLLIHSGSVWKWWETWKFHLWSDELDVRVGWCFIVYCWMVIGVLLSPRWWDRIRRHGTSEHSSVYSLRVEEHQKYTLSWRGPKQTVRENGSSSDEMTTITKLQNRTRKRANQTKPPMCHLNTKVIVSHPSAASARQADSVVVLFRKTQRDVHTGRVTVVCGMEDR